MARYVVIDKAGTVVNVVEWDEEADWDSPDDCRIVRSDAAGPGWIMQGKVLVDPSPPAPVISATKIKPSGSGPADATGG